MESELLMNATASICDDENGPNSNSIALTGEKSYERLVKDDSDAFRNETESTVNLKESKISNIYILWSLIAALMMATTSFLKTIASETPYTSFFVLCFSCLVITVVVLSVIKCKIYKKFKLAFNVKSTDNSDDSME